MNQSLKKLKNRTYGIIRSLPTFIIGTITNVTTKEPVAALTFDDGPDPGFTPKLLNILAKHNAYATFFMIGKAAERYPELVQQVAQAGHAIGNHSWDHLSFRAINRRQRLQQIRSCSKAIAPYGLKLFRPPYGDQSITSRIDAFLLGYKVITWNIAANDWEKHDPEWIFNKLERSLKPGSIILLHDSLWTTIVKGTEDRSYMLKALDMFLERNITKFRFITIPELFRYGKTVKRIWFFDSKIEKFTLYRKSGFLD